MYMLEDEPFICEFRVNPTETLPEFIAHHTVEKLCLPCKLVLPKSSAGSGGVPQVRRKPAGMKQALQTGAGELCMYVCVAWNRNAKFKFLPFSDDNCM